MIPAYSTWQEGKRTAWLAGMAWTICSDVAVGNARRNRLWNGQEDVNSDRIHHSAVIMAHETAHLLCAHHVDWRINLMHSAANQYTDLYPKGLPVLRYTKREIQKAFRRVR